MTSASGSTGSAVRASGMGCWSECMYGPSSVSSGLPPSAAVRSGHIVPFCIPRPTTSMWSHAGPRNSSIMARTCAAVASSTTAGTVQ